MIPANLAELVTFVPNKEEPIHNWFYYKEGYSRGLVHWLVKEFALQEPILDPFCGVGTTLLCAKELGLKATGLDVSPLAAFASRVKTRNYDIAALERELQKLLALEPSPITEKRGKIFKKIFFEKTWNNMQFYKQAVGRIQDEKLRDFFLLAVIDATAKVANLVKMGGSLRRTKKPQIPFAKLFFRKAKQMIGDLKQARISGIEPEVLQADARFAKLEPESFGCCITSPPYLNKIEYTTVYKLELGMFFNTQETKLRAYIADAPTGATSDGKQPVIAKAYFDDMEKVQRNIFSALKPGGKSIIVVGGGCFPYSTVESDDILIEQAEHIGFRLAKKIVARNIHCMRNRTIKVGTVRESVIVLEKP